MSENKTTTINTPYGIKISARPNMEDSLRCKVRHGVEKSSIAKMYAGTAYVVETKMI
jgi:hypothetical protein